MIHPRLVLFGLVAGVTLMAGTVRAAEVMVFAAASLSDVLRELEQPFEEKTGHRVRWSFGGSGLLARQLQEGVPADVFISADEARMDQVEQRDLIQAETRVVLVANQLVIVAPKAARTAIQGVDDLVHADVQRVALGNPAIVPAGTYARTYLENVGVWSRVAEKVVPLENVRAVLSAVAFGNADAGLVYRTDALISADVTVVFEVPVVDGPRIVYPAAMMRDARSPAAARALLAFLTEADAQAVFRRHGFLEFSP